MVPRAIVSASAGGWRSSGKAIAGDTTSWRVEDCLFACVIVLAPYLLGGRHPLGRLVYVGLFLMLGIWAIASVTRGSGRSLRLRWTDWCVIALLHAMLAMQLVALPDTVLTRIAPEINQLLSLWNRDAAPANGLRWNTLSVFPQQTRLALALVSGFVIFFIAGVYYCADRRRIDTLVRLFAVSGIAMAVVGLAQYLTQTDKFLWVYEHPTRGPAGSATGAFANHNHFAHFLALALGPIIAQIVGVTHAGRTLSSDPIKHVAHGQQRNSHRRLTSSVSRLESHQRWIGPSLWFAGLVVVLVAILLSRSRGGYAIATVTLLVAGMLLWRTGKLDLKIIAFAASIPVVLCAALVIHGEDAIQSKIESIRQADSLVELSPDRFELWSAHAKGFRGSPWLGYGAGCHVHSYRSFMDRHVALRFTHGESGYMSVLHETGAIGILAVLAILTLFWTRSIALFANPNNHLILCGVLPMAVASTLHALVDFVWYIPACLSGAIVALIIVRSLTLIESEQRTDGKSLQSSLANNWHWGGALAVCMFLIMQIAPLYSSATASFAQDDYRRETRIALRDVSEAPIDHRQLFEICNQVLMADWSAPDVHCTMAKIYLAEANARRAAAKLPIVPQPGEFEDRSLAEIRKDYAADLPYLAAAAQHAWIAIHQCPLESDAYVILADMHPLLGIDDLRTEDLLRQAYRSDPHSGSVLYRMGQMYAAGGDFSEASKVWTEAFRDHPVVREQLVNSLWGTLPQELLLQLFDPDADALRAIFYQLQKQNKIDLLQQIAPVTARRVAASAGSQTPRVAAVTLYDASCYAEAGNEIDLAIEYGEQALRLRHGTIEQHRRMARLHLTKAHYDKAEPHLVAILRLDPSKADAMQMLLQVRAALATGTMVNR
jgi:tetratricopeptide (TPR) repeat protein